MTAIESPGELEPLFCPRIKVRADNSHMGAGGRDHGQYVRRGRGSNDLKAWIMAKRLR